MDEQLKQSALAYHENPRPGKISVTPLKLDLTDYAVQDRLAQALGAAE